MIPAGASIEEALKFYTEQMAFSVVWKAEGMAGIERDGVGFNLVQNTNQEWADNASFSIGVRGLKSLYEEYRDIRARVGPLEMKSWGRREFHLIAPPGIAFQFYESEGATENG